MMGEVARQRTALLVQVVGGLVLQATVRVRRVDGLFAVGRAVGAHGVEERAVLADVRLGDILAGLLAMAVDHAEPGKRVFGLDDGSCDSVGDAFNGIRDST